MKKIGLLLVSLCAALLIASCDMTSSGVKDKDPAVGRGVSAWNLRGPSAANAYWSEIKDNAKRKKYLNYVNVYNAGVNALDSTDSVKTESKLLSSCNTALAKFNSLDPNLKLPTYVCEKGAKLAAGRIDKLLAADKVSEASKMYNTAYKVYNKNKNLDNAGKQVEVCKTIANRKASLLAQAEKANEIENFDSKLAAYDAILAKCPAAEAEVNNLVKSSPVGQTDGVQGCAKNFKKVRQDIAIQREGAYRDKIYEFKNTLGEQFARQPEKGSGKDGQLTSTEMLAFLKSVEKDMNATYADFLAFAEAHPKDVSADTIADVKAQKDLLNAKIASVNRQIANEKEVASRGKTVFPIIIGLFNAAPGTSGANKKSRPAKFSATGAKNNEYWWGMVSIPKGQSNDLVITMKDNRTVRVFNENTKSGKNIEKNGLQDLVNRSSKVGNSWPVLNAGSQLKGSGTDKLYFFEVQKGKTESYSGEVVVYNSFVVRTR